MAARICVSCHETPVATSDGENIKFSTRVGVTEYEAGKAIETALSRVDELLYKAKGGATGGGHSQSDGFLCLQFHG